MEYYKFLQDIKQLIEEKLEDNYQVEISRILKNNGVELDGILILKEGSKIIPSIYLDSYFLEYKKGKDIEWIVQEIIKNYYQLIEKETNTDSLFSFTEMKKWIIFRLINFKENKEILKQFAYIRFLDLAITFHCLIEKKESEISTIQVTKQLEKTWGITTKELMELAANNTPFLFPASIRTMDEVIKDILRQEIEQSFLEYNQNKEQEEDLDKKINSDSIIEEILNNGNKEEDSIYILTNSKGIYGASALLYKDLMKEFAETFQSDFYILPSSIHEVILTPINKIFKKEDLINIVFDVNNTQVPTEDILSDQVYIYRYATNSFEI